MICTFFGHKDTPEAVRGLLHKTLQNLIENKNVDLFYVGNQGNFDALVAKELENLQKVYPHIRYYIVLAYMPTKKSTAPEKTADKTIFPEEIAQTPPKFAIDKRNRWMIERCDYVVTYVQFIVGGAVKYKTFAEKKGKTVLNLAELLK